MNSKSLNAKPEVLSGELQLVDFHIQTQLPANI